MPHQEKTPWESLRDAYQEYGLVLCLGAGVSRGSNLPDWKTLLERLAEKVLSPQEQSALVNDIQLKVAPGCLTPLVDALTKLGLSLPAVASLLEAKVPSDSSNATRRESFLAHIENILYADLYASIPGLDSGQSSAKQEFVVRTKQENPTMASLAAMAVVKRNEAFRPNPRVPAIVNFNLDGLFRTYCRTRYRSGLPLFRTIERANKRVKHGLIRYYHPHGFLPLRKGSDNSRDLVVFTEADYFDFFNQPTGLFTYTLLSLLREYPILFVGLSFHDGNLRRLLHYSLSERQAHARRERGAKEENDEKLHRHFVVLEQHNAEVDRILRDSLRPLGVRPLFVKTFAELPDRLAEVYGADWRLVYG